MIMALFDSVEGSVKGCRLSVNKKWITRPQENTSEASECGKTFVALRSSGAIQLLVPAFVCITLNALFRTGLVLRPKPESLRQIL